MRTIDELKRLDGLLAGGITLRAEREWGGAGVVVSHESPPPREGGFYAPPRWVVSAHALEVSWIFESLRDAFNAESRIDHCSKFEFFGRLANAASRCLDREPTASAVRLCAAVLREAFVMYGEMEEGDFRFFAVTVGNEIVDDYVDHDASPSAEGTEDPGLVC